MSYEQLFRRTASLAGASTDVLRLLSDAATSRTLRKGDALWRAGDPARSFSVVRSGLLKIVRIGPGGRRAICGVFGPPESIGDVVVLRGKPYPADALVISPAATIVSVPRDVLLACIQRCPEIGVSVACSIHTKLAALHGSIEVLSAGSVEARLATALLNLYRQFGDDFDDGTSSIPIALSRRELSDLVSTSVETVIRIMSRWERERIICTEGDGFVISNPELLRACAGQGSQSDRDSGMDGAR